jgi:hypothetical protein
MASVGIKIRCDTDGSFLFLFLIRLLLLSHRERLGEGEQQTAYFADGTPGRIARRRFEPIALILTFSQGEKGSEGRWRIRSSAAAAASTVDHSVANGRQWLGSLKFSIIIHLCLN